MYKQLCKIGKITGKIKHELKKKNTENCKTVAINAAYPL